MRRKKRNYIRDVPDRPMDNIFTESLWSSLKYGGYANLSCSCMRGTCESYVQANND